MHRAQVWKEAVVTLTIVWDVVIWVLSALCLFAGGYMLGVDVQWERDLKQWAKGNARPTRYTPERKP